MTCDRPDDDCIPRERTEDTYLEKYIRSIVNENLASCWCEILSLKQRVAEIESGFQMPLANIVNAGKTSSCDLHESSLQEERRQKHSSLAGEDVNAALRAAVPSGLLQFQAPDTDDVLVDHWSFRNSYWDVAAFLGNRTVFEFPEAVANLLLLIVNVVVQACFVIIVSYLAVSSLDDETIDGYHKWRTNTGHALQYMDLLTERSLADRVCSGDTSLHLSDTQSSQVDNIRGYMKDNAPFNGPMMCVLAVLAWSLTVSKEFHVLKDMVNACLNVPLGRTVITKESNRLALKSLSRCRFNYILALVVLRAAIASALLYIGIKYLIVTISIEDILLNAVALEFILNVDELMFEALAPNKTRRLILLMRPLRLPAKRQWRGLDFDFVLCMLAITIIFSVCIPLWLLCEMENMERAEEELCGGLLHFSYSLSVVGTVTWAEAQLGSSEEAWRILKTTTRYQVLRSVIEDSWQDKIFATMSNAQYLTGSGWSVQGLERWDSEQLGDEANSDCLDVASLPSHYSFYMGLAALRDFFQNQSISSCRDVAQHCNDYSASSVRLFCPNMCECQDPSSSLALPYPANGCPTSCLLSSTYKGILDQLECSEVPQELLNESSTWRAFLENFVTATSAWDGYSVDWPQMQQVLARHGCDARDLVLDLYGIDVCGGYAFKSLQIWCPTTCQCSSRAAGISNQCSTKC